MKKLFSVMDEVEKMLLLYPSLRDNDERLMANIWYKFIGDNTLTYTSGFNVLSMLSKGKLPSYESVSRCRRKIQELKPKLRGEKWIERQRRAKKIKKEMPSYQCLGDDAL